MGARPDLGIELEGDWLGYEGSTSQVVPEKSLGRGVGTLIGGSFIHGLAPERLRAAALLVGDHGSSPWAFIQCHGHGCGRHTRIRLRAKDNILSVQYDTRGALWEEVYEDEGGDYAAGGDPSRLRLICPHEGCGRSGSRNAASLETMLLAALLKHRDLHSRGLKKPAIVSWWKVPTA